MKTQAPQDHARLAHYSKRLGRIATASGQFNDRVAINRPPFRTQTRFGISGRPIQGYFNTRPRRNTAARDRMPQAQMSSLPPNKGNNSGQTDTVSVELYKKEQGGPSRPHSQQPHFQSGVGHRMTICATESSQVNLYSGHILPASSRHGNKLQLCVF